MLPRFPEHIRSSLVCVVTAENPSFRKLDQASRANDNDLGAMVEPITNEGGNVRGTVFGIRSDVTRGQPGLDNPHRVVNLCRVEHDLRGCGKSTRHTEQEFKMRLPAVFKYKAALEHLDTEVREANRALSRLENQAGRHGSDTSSPVVELVANRTGC